MEALNNTKDQRRANITDALSAWVATSRRGRVRTQVSENYIIVGRCPDKGDEPVINTDDVACLFAHELRRHPNPDSDIHALVVRDDDGECLVIDAEGVPLCFYIDVEEDNAECPYILKVQVLDSMPTVEVKFYTSDRTLTVRKDAYRRMEWEVPMPTRRKVREMCCYLIGAVQDFPAQSRVERVYGIGNALGVLARSSPAYGYRDFVDWLTPMTGIDPGGEGWEREKFLALAEDGNDTQTIYTWRISHPDCKGELELKVTNWESRDGWEVELHVKDGVHRSTVEEPTQSHIVGYIATWMKRNRKET